MTDERLEKHSYYLSVCNTILSRSTCLRRKYGAIIVKNDEIISTGYNGAPRGRHNCNTIGQCVRIVNNIPHGEKYELCRSVHAEANAIISAKRQDMIEATLYLNGIENGLPVTILEPCEMCKRLIINSGITEVVVFDKLYGYRIYSVDNW